MQILLVIIVLGISSTGIASLNNSNTENLVNQANALLCKAVVHQKRAEYYQKLIHVAQANNDLASIRHHNNLLALEEAEMTVSFARYEQAKKQANF